MEPSPRSLSTPSFRPRPRVGLWHPRRNAGLDPDRPVVGTTLGLLSATFPSYGLPLSRPPLNLAKPLQAEVYVTTSRAGVGMAHQLSQFDVRDLADRFRPVGVAGRVQDDVLPGLCSQADAL